MDRPVVHDKRMIKVRFVGGPWHNSVRTVPRSTWLDVSYNATGEHDPVNNASRHFMDRCRYRLCRFESKQGAQFYQYVLEADADQLLSEEAHA
jgi:hypothetical protein